MSKSSSDSRAPQLKAFILKSGLWPVACGLCLMPGAWGLCLWAGSVASACGLCVWAGIVANTIMLNPLALYPPPQGPLGAGRSPPKRASLPRKKRQYRGDSVFEIDGGTAFFGLCAERASISDLGRSWGASRAPFGLLFGHLGCLLGSFWAPLGPSWGHLGAILGHLGAILHPSWPSWQPTPTNTNQHQPTTANKSQQQPTTNNNQQLPTNQPTTSQRQSTNTNQPTPTNQHQHKRTPTPTNTNK